MHGDLIILVSFVCLIALDLYFIYNIKLLIFISRVQILIKLLAQLVFNRKTTTKNLLNA